MTAFDELLDEAEAAPVDTWDFGWLDGRAIEERPSWRYFDQVVERAARASGVLELQAGVGNMIGRLPSLPPRAVATEGYPPSLAIAGPRLRSRAIPLVRTSPREQAVPLRERSFDLVISRHPVEVWWAEIARVLEPGGVYFAQHVGPHSLRSLSEVFLGPLPASTHRDPAVEQRGAELAGLEVRTITIERPRTAFYDIGAVVYFLRLVPWIVPGFSVAAHADALRTLHATIERDGAFESTACRTLLEVVKP